MTDKRESCQEEVRRIFCAALKTQSFIEVNFDSESNTGLILVVPEKGKTESYLIKNGEITKS